MGFLGDIFEDYYYTNDKKIKENLINEFKCRIWDSLPYIKLERSFRYEVVETIINNKNDLELLKKYEVVKYKILKSRYNINELEKEDLIKARINSNYGKYCDNEIYLGKKYYKALANFKNIYFKYINKEIDNLNQAIKNNEEKIKIIKEKCIDRKFNISWNDYRLFIDLCFDKIFKNYKPIEDKINKGEFTPNHILDWDEDNYILGYINKSLNGYLKNFIKENNGQRKKKKYKICESCGKLIIKKNNKTKYCKSCAREKELEKYRKYNKKRK